MKPNNRLHKDSGQKAALTCEPERFGIGNNEYATIQGIRFVIYTSNIAEQLHTPDGKKRGKLGWPLVTRGVKLYGPEIISNGILSNSTL